MKSINSAISDILQARENRFHLIQELLKTKKIVVSLKANIPGAVKQRKEAYLLLSLFDCLINLDYSDKIFLDNSDGPCLIYLLNDGNPYLIKTKMMALEDQSPVGRLIDIDVFSNNDQSIKRRKLRKCLICEEPAFLCIRLKKHQEDELLKQISQIVNDELSIKIEHLIDESIMAELNLEPKFGLVTPSSTGSHKDMNYHLMIKAKEAIKPYLIKMFFEGYTKDDLPILFINIRKIGLEAEKAMMKATSNINCYKGLIFNLGLVLASSAYVLSNKLFFEDIFIVIEKMTQGISSELVKAPSTFGMIAYQKYQIGGARKEAELGFPTIQKVLPLLKSINKEDLTLTLIELIKHCEDTVLLKRCGSVEKYLFFKNLINSIKEYNESQIKAITEECINNNVSFGGSADLLITTIYLKRFKEVFSLDYFKKLIK